ncbi:hypothetical protein [Enterococcus durans]|uniref:hypothetical protein n=1 Tax=Enterococcus durans TaxID=53345 RepID=UPI001C8BF77D|nr:hypothetical protein [Enterococcus durans]MBX9040568.1 hypothetical protein [Enterococcus durans]MBX9077250.1 hypothetical protein [Enterococcus durans]
MRMIRYSTARLVYYKKQTIFYCLFSSIAAFLLMLACNLYHVQTTIYSQVQERLNFLDITAVKANLPSIVTIRQFYLKVIVILLTIFSVMFIFFFQRSLRQDSQELINWRLAGLSKGKIFLFIAWQLMLPLLICCTVLFLWIVLFQRSYQEMIQQINFLCLKFFDMQDIHSLATTSKLAIPMDQQTFFKIEFVNDLFLIDTLKGFYQTVLMLAGTSMTLSILQFSIFYHRLKKGRMIFFDTI